MQNKMDNTEPKGIKGDVHQHPMMSGQEDNKDLKQSVMEGQVTIQEMIPDVEDYKCEQTQTSDCIPQEPMQKDQDNIQEKVPDDNEGQNTVQEKPSFDKEIEDHVNKNDSDDLKPPILERQDMQEKVPDDNEGQNTVQPSFDKEIEDHVNKNDSDDLKPPILERQDMQNGDNKLDEYKDPEGTNGENEDDKVDKDKELGASSDEDNRDNDEEEDDDYASQSEDSDVNEDDTLDEDYDPRASSDEDNRDNTDNGDDYMSGREDSDDTTSSGALVIDIGGLTKIPYAFSPIGWDNWSTALKMGLSNAIIKELQAAIMPLINQRTPRQEYRQPGIPLFAIPDWIRKEEEEIRKRRQIMWETYYKDLVEDGTLGHPLHNLLKRSNQLTEEESPKEKKVKLDDPLSLAPKGEMIPKLVEPGCSGVNQVAEDKDKEEPEEIPEYFMQVNSKIGMEVIEIDLEFSKLIKN
ncbi:unnamed protein product [Nezara viridula]|uniref:Uncharacterized protein n=1 Tax=Nezara viridula TaxID=85310 RepID=A0A9P0H2K2_NEZVI|nr:unnamed protein product [Nezara viridula]